MPFIKGRYHVNPTIGAALEAAREAEAAMLALQDHAHRNGDDSSDSASNAGSTNGSAHSTAPVHRVEIEVTELEGLPGQRLVEPGRSVPTSSGRATSGFTARVHRSASRPPAPTDAGASCSYNLASAAPATKPETHVFSNHADLLNFLHNELSKR